MTLLDTLPATPEGLTPEWLSAVLHGGGFAPGAAITSVTTEDIGTGVGFIGQVCRVKLEYAGADGAGPASLIAKLPATDPGSRMVGVAFGMYEREVRFYRELAPELSMPSPACYHAAYDPAAGQSVILLEDLQGGQFGDQLAGATPEQAALAVDALARMHAEWWLSPRLGQFPWLTFAIENIRTPIMMMYEAAWRPAVERVGHLLTPAMIEMLPDMGKRCLVAFDNIGALPLTLGHGDYRPDNLFFGGPESPRPLVVCDWQGPGKSPAVADIAYFIAGALHPDDRRAHEDELLRRYHNILLEGGVKDYSLAALKDDYRAYFALTLAGAMVLCGTLPDGNERGHAMIERTVERFVAAMVDLDSLALLPAL